MWSSPYTQASLLGCSFFFTFTAYDTIQVFAKRLYEEYGSADLGANMTLCIYVLFTASSLFAPALVNQLGPRLSMCCGILCYATLVTAGLVYFETAGAWNWLVLLSGCILGFGAAMLWTGQGRITLEYSNERNRGSIFAIFWMLYRGASLVGGALSWGYFSIEGNNAGSSELFVIFLILVICGACSILLLRDPQYVNTGNAPDLHTAHTRESWRQETVNVIGTYRSSSMLLLAGLCWFGGFTEPYILSGFTDRYLTKRATGAEMTVFFACSILGTWACARLLDLYSRRNKQRRGARVAMVAFTVVHAVAFGSAGTVEFAMQSSLPLKGWELGDLHIALPTVAFAFWGASDAMMNTYICWLIGCLYPGGPERARAIGFSKMVNSAGHVLGFAILPAHRVPGQLQFILNTAFFAFGITTGWFVLPPMKAEEPQLL